MKIITRSLASASFALASLGASAAWADVAPDEDMTPPNVSFAAPNVESMLQGDPAVVTIEVDADDPDSGVGAVTVYVDDEMLIERTSAPYEWEDVELSPGKHTLVAEAKNGDGYPGSASIEVTVTAGAGDGGSASSGASAADGSGGDGGSGGDDKGGCAAGPRPRTLVGSGIAFGLAIVAGIALRRRGAD